MLNPPDIILKTFGDEKPKCLNCGKEVKRKVYGKPRKYCSYACLYDYNRNKKGKAK